MRRMQTIEKVIGENTFYIRPFGAFAAANISGELAALLSPILAGIAPLFGGLDTGDNGSDAEANPLDMDIEEAIHIDDYVKLESKTVTGYFRVAKLTQAGDNISGDWTCTARLMEVQG